MLILTKNITIGIKIACCDYHIPSHGWKNLLVGIDSQCCCGTNLTLGKTFSPLASSSRRHILVCTYNSYDKTHICTPALVRIALTHTVHTLVSSSSPLSFSLVVDIYCSPVQLQQSPLDDRTRKEFLPKQASNFHQRRIECNVNLIKRPSTL